MSDNNSDATNSIPTVGPGLRSIIKKIDDLPVIPPVAMQALSISLKDDVDLKKLGSVVESDPILTAKILKLVNHTYSPAGQSITNVKQAIARAGLNQIRCALLGVMFRDHLASDKQKISEDSKQLWAHSLMSAVLAKFISKKTYPEIQEAAFVGSLLHDIGKMIIMEVFAASHLQIEDLKAEKRVSSLGAEQEVIETNHSVVGKILGKQWNLPDYIVDCISFHHHFADPEKSFAAHKELLSIVILGNIMAHEVFCDHYPASADIMLKKQALAAIGLKDKDTEDIKQEATKDYALKAEVFDLESDLNSLLHSIVQKANKKLSKIGLELESKNCSLSRNNQILDLAHMLGLKLNPFLDKQNIFDAVADAFIEFSPIQAGFVYSIEPETRELEGIFWRQGRTKQKFLCFLDKDGHPVWEHDDQHLPPDLKKILAEHAQRKQKTGFPLLNTCSYFEIYSFKGDQGLFGELCLLFEQDFESQAPEVVKVFSQIAQMLKSSLERTYLYDRLEKRTEELSLAVWKNRQMNLELMQAERLATVGQLAAGAAHEINNPLAIISARAQLLQYNEQDEKRKKELNLISDQIDRISKILSNLMDFARPVPPSLQQTDIHKILDKVLEFIGNGFKRYKISLVKQYDPDLTYIKADPAQLEQVFLNLCINAQHAMEETGGTLTVSTSLKADKDRVIISIEDQGVGISNENLNKVFDPFFTTKEQGKGTGLGLSTTYGIVQNHFGDINISSAPGQGTTIKVSLPVNISDLKPAVQEEQPSDSRPSEEMRQRILVVDDEQHIRDILRETLEQENMLVETAVNGQEGLEILQEQSFDLMLLDIKMPLRDGLSLLREIRKIDNSMPVIVITGMASHEDMQEAIDQGSRCIRKPFHIKDLLAQINDILSTG